MKKHIVALVASMMLFTSGRALAVELLFDGDFETHAGVFDVVGWKLSEFMTGSGESVNSAELTGEANHQLFLRAFEGGGPFTPAQGNFDSDGFPNTDVDGKDFLAWQRGYGNGGRLPSQGDATGDMNVDCADLSIWQNNYGTSPARNFANARLSQKVSGAPGETYTFRGTSTFEENYSGFVTTLGDASPHGQIPSPTVTQFRLEFLNSVGGVIGSPTLLDLRTEQLSPGAPVVHSPLVAVAPAGTTFVRVIAEALNMAWNGTSISNGALQSAYFDDFSLNRASDPGMELLINGDLNPGTINVIDFWHQDENPVTRYEILRAGTAFSNHTPGGYAGVWLSSSFGEHPCFEDEPVDGSLSQTIQAVPGGIYTFSGWTKFEYNYSGGVDTINTASPGFLAGQPSPTQSLITLEFLDITESVIASSVIDVKAERQAACPAGDANSQSCGPAANGWTQHTFSNIVAPAGAVRARLRADMIDGVFNLDPQQSVFWDDFSLDGPAPPEWLENISVPEPASGIMFCLAAGLLGLRRWR